MPTRKSNASSRRPGTGDGRSTRCAARRWRSGSRKREATSVMTTRTAPVTSSCTRNETPAAATRLAVIPPVTAPSDHSAWKRVMIERPTFRCSSTACEFIATSVRPSRAPSTSSTANTSTAVEATPSKGSHRDIAADVVMVIVRLPRRSTSQPLNRLAARPPTPMPTSVRPRAASEIPRSAWTSGRRGVHDDNVAPLTKNTAPIAAAATRSWRGCRPCAGSRRRISGTRTRGSARPDDGRRCVRR